VKSRFGPGSNSAITPLILAPFRSVHLLTPSPRPEEACLIVPNRARRSEPEEVRPLADREARQTAHPPPPRVPTGHRIPAQSTALGPKSTALGTSPPHDPKKPVSLSPTEPEEIRPLADREARQTAHPPPTRVPTGHRIPAQSAALGPKSTALGPKSTALGTSPPHKKTLPGSIAPGEGLSSIQPHGNQCRQPAKVTSDQGAILPART